MTNIDNIRDNPVAWEGCTVRAPLKDNLEKLTGTFRLNHGSIVVGDNLLMDDEVVSIVALD
jgi:hypothetical protein